MAFSENARYLDLGLEDETLRAAETIAKNACDALKQCETQAQAIDIILEMKAKATDQGVPLEQIKTAVFGITGDDMVDFFGRSGGPGQMIMDIGNLLGPLC